MAFSCPSYCLLGGGLPRLATEHADASHVNADEPPGHQVFEGGERPDKRVCVGAVRVPVAGIHTQAS